MQEAGARAALTFRRGRIDTPVCDLRPAESAPAPHGGIRDGQYPVGSAQFGVPRPTLYVIDRTGTIRLRSMEPTYQARPDLAMVLRDAAALIL